MAKREPHTSTKAETTGHEWDGVTELNKPLPKWWLWTFYATIVWAIGYWLLMPAWPLVSSYTKGFLGYSQRETVTEEVAAAKSAKSAYRDKIAAMDLTAISNDPELLSFALAGGEAAFGDNCAPCHGRGAQGAVGYPNLRDDSWLWGDGSLAAIHQTILHGIRADDPETHTSQMPAFGRTGNSVGAADPRCRGVRPLSLGQGRRQDGGRARGKDLQRQLCRLSWPRRQGQSAARRAKSRR